MFSKRIYERFNIPLIVAFRSTKKDSEYSMGIIKNFSRGGISFMSYAASAVPAGKVEINLRFPNIAESIPVPGNIIWTKHKWNKFTAGAKIGAMDDEAESWIMDKLSKYGHISKDRLLNTRDSFNENIDPHELMSAPELITAKSLQEQGSVQAGPVKQYIRNRSICRVTFRLPGSAAQDAQNVTIAGDFNEWDIAGTPMKRNEDGDFIVTIDLASGRAYRFRYLIDGYHWENDSGVDEYVPNAYGSDDSLLYV